MKEQIINNVLSAMQGVLDCRQMKLLKVSLQEQLQGVRVSQTETPNAEDNLLVLDSFISAKRIEGCSERSMRYYRTTIEQFLTAVCLPITQITTAQIREYLVRYQAERQCGKVTIDNMRRILSSFFAWLEDEDYIVKSPVRRIHKVKTDLLVRETLSDELLEQMRDKCDNLRDLAMLDLLASTGMRVGELVRLNRADLNFRSGNALYLVRETKSGLYISMPVQRYTWRRTCMNGQTTILLCLSVCTLPIGDCR